MPRRKSSEIDVIFKIGAMLPWYVSLATATAAYFILDHYSQTAIPVTTSADDIGQTIIVSAIKTTFSIARYVVPLLLVGGAVASLIASARRGTLFRGVVAGKSRLNINELNWTQFEHLIHQYFQEQGYNVSSTSTGADGGVDLRLSKDGLKTIVQCKHWKSSKVGVQVVREQFGIMTAEGAGESIVVTSGRFTREAETWASGKPIRLVDGEQLSGMLDLLDPDRMFPETIETNASQICPRCDSAMVLRTAKRGPNAGTEFWGCSEYPRCRGTRPA